MLKINEDIYIAELGLYVKSEKTLVISDLHIGYEEVLNKQGIFVPRFHFRDLTKKIESIFLDLDWNKHKVEKIIINGDLKHDFGSITRQEEREVKIIFDMLKKNVKKVVFIEGNHDKLSRILLKNFDVEVKDFEYFEASKLFVCHGDKLMKNPQFTKAKTVIIGHEHPAITLKEAGKSEMFKCFLVGKYKDKQLIVQPSMNLLVEGTDVLNSKLLSPFLDDVSDFECFVVSDKVYGFGRVEEVERRN